VKKSHFAECFSDCFIALSPGLNFERDKHSSLSLRILNDTHKKKFFFRLNQERSDTLLEPRKIEVIFSPSSYFLTTVVTASCGSIDSRTLYLLNGLLQVTGFICKSQPLNVML
jgi:hypothetical protein